MGQEVCQECGKPIAKMKWWQKYCGGTCRSRGYWKRKLREAREEVLREGVSPLEKSKN